MRRFLCLVLMLVVAAGVAASEACATTKTILDTTLIRAYQNLAPTTYVGKEWLDVIGVTGGGDPFVNGFDVSKVEVSRSNGDVSFKIYTNYPAGGIKLGSFQGGVADLFIDLGANGGPVGGFDLVIKMSGPDIGKVYSAAGPWTLYYSNYYFGTSGYRYGGLYDFDDPKPVPVVFDGITTIGAGTVEWTGTGPYIIDIILPGVNLSGAWNKFAFLWATAHCANDAIYGVAAPLPGSLLLIGSGLLGMLAFRKRL